MRYVVVGIGINVNHKSFSGELEPIATSLRMESGREWSRVELGCRSAKIARQRVPEADRGRSNGAAWHPATVPGTLLFARSRHVHVDEGGGYEGVTEGLDDRGFLLVRTPAGLRTVFSGMVRALDGK